jgi:hypothetical protein
MHLLSSSSLMRSVLTSRVNAPVAIRQPLVLISQIQRCGGTLLSQLFDAHPDCYSYPGELEWGYPTKYDWPSYQTNRHYYLPFLLKRLNPSPLDTWIRYGYNKDSASSKNNGQFPFIFDKDAQRQIVKRCMDRQKATSSRDVLNAYMTSFFNSWLDYQNMYAGKKKYVVAFTPRVNMSQLAFDGLRNDYPDGHLISCVRNPVSWLVSATRHNPRMYQDVEKSLALWKLSTAKTVHLSQTHKDYVIPVIFEELVSNTKETLALIFARLKLGWAATAETPTFNSMPIRADSSFSVQQFGVVKERAAIDSSKAAEFQDSSLMKEMVAFYSDSCQRIHEQR